jgi:sulfur carrier protein
MHAVFVNDEPREVDEAATLASVLAAMGLSERNGVAAAVNGEVVPRSSWRARPLAPRDRVVVIRATQGG